MAVRMLSCTARFDLNPNASTPGDNLIKNYRFFSGSAQIIFPSNQDVRILRVSTLPRFNPVGWPFIPSNGMDVYNRKRIGTWQYLIKFRVLHFNGVFTNPPACNFIGDPFFCSFARENNIGFWTTSEKPYFEPFCLYGGRLQINEFAIYTNDFFDITPVGDVLHMQVEFTIEYED